jgi:hypothetical protein
MEDRPLFTWSPRRGHSVCIRVGSDRGMMQRMAVRAAVPALVLVAVTSCAASAPAPIPSAASPATPTSPGSAPKAADCDTGAWRSAPIKATLPVAGLAIVTGVRTAAHPECGYDRLVLDTTGPLQSYDIRYVGQVIADPSGKPITLPGRSFLLITLRPAQAHAGSGAPTVTRDVQALGYPVLKGYALAGDFEGVLTLALGLRGTASIRVGELPDRWYIDVRA